MDWIQGLDRYLTSGPPDDGFTGWCEQTLEAMDERFYNDNEEWVMAETGQCNDLLNECYNRDMTPKQAAEYIQNQKTPPIMSLSILEKQIDNEAFQRATKKMNERFNNLNNYVSDHQHREIYLDEVFTMATIEDVIGEGPLHGRRMTIRFILQRVYELQRERMKETLVQEMVKKMVSELPTETSTETIFNFQSPVGE